MLKLTIFWKMEKIHRRLPQTRSAASGGRGTRYALTPGQLREPQLGACSGSKSTFLVKNWAKGKKD